MLKNAATQARKRPRGQRARWFGHPLILLAIIAALGLDFWSIQTSTRHAHSTIKRTVLNAVFGVPPPPPGPPPPRPSATFLNVYGTLTLQWNQPSENIPADLMRFPPTDDGGWDAVGNMYGPYAHQRGFYHPTRQRTTIRFSEWPGRATKASLMALYVEAFDALPGPISPTLEGRALAHARTLCAANQDTGTKPLPTGYLRNTFTLTLLALLLALPILGRTDLWLAAISTRVLQRPKPWQCQTCSYDVRGLEQCPECGTTVERDR